MAYKIGSDFKAFWKFLGNIHAIVNGDLRFFIKFFVVKNWRQCKKDKCFLIYESITEYENM